MASRFSTVRKKYRRFREREGKMKIILEYLIGYPLFSFLTSCLLSPILWMLGSHRKIRLSVQKYTRIGGYGMTMELFLRRRFIGKDVTYDRVAQYLNGGVPHMAPASSQVRREHCLHTTRPSKELWIFLSGQPANRQLMNMIKRHVRVYDQPVAFWLYRQIQPFLAGRFKPFIPGDLNDYEVWNTVSPILQFTPEEEAQGRELLKRMGITAGELFVCFHARDSAYLDTATDRSKVAYHDFRDCDINNCLPAAEYLAGEGLFALRMGSVVKQSIEPRHTRILDYATHQRSDFGDIFLPAKCKFFLGSNSGLATIPLIFNRPVALTNVIDVTGPASGARDLSIFKKLWLIQEKRFFTFREIIDRGIWKYMRTEQFTRTGIEVIENSAEEILALAKEMNARLDGTWVPHSEDEELQRRFRALFPPNFPWAGFPGRIGAEFLRQNRELLESPVRCYA